MVNKNIIKILDKCGDIYGSGIVISNKKSITALHVVESITGDVFINFPFINNDNIIINKIKKDKKNDICYLYFSSNISIEENDIFIKYNDSFVGNKYIVYGFPEDFGDSGIISSGVIEGILPNNVVQLKRKDTTGQEITHGFSGGAVFLKDTRNIIGIITEATPSTSKLGFAYNLILDKQQANRKKLYSAPSIFDFIGREKELQEITMLLKNPSLSVIALYGVAGIGKSKIASKIANSVAGYDFVIWHSLVNPYSLNTFLNYLYVDVIETNSENNNFNIDIDTIIDLLSKNKILLILDNYETILMSEYKGEYETFFKIFIESNNKSKIIITSRVESKNIKTYINKKAIIFKLKGMDIHDSCLLLSEKINKDSCVVEIVKKYNGNPLAIKIIKSYIYYNYRNDYCKYINTLSDQNIGELDKLIHWHYSTLTDNEKIILGFIVIQRKAVTIEEISDFFKKYIFTDGITKEINSIKNKHLIEDNRKTVYIQPYIMDFLSNILVNYFIDNINSYIEIISNSNNTIKIIKQHSSIKPNYLYNIPIINIDSNENIRSSQRKFLLDKIYDKLLFELGGFDFLNIYINEILSFSRKFNISNYLPSNIILIMLKLRNENINNYNFDGLYIKKMDFSSSTMKKSSFIKSTFDECIFLQNNSGILSTSISKKGKLFASGDMSGGVRVYNSKNQDLIYESHIHSGWIPCIIFLTDNELLSVSDDKSIIIHNIVDNKITKEKRSAHNSWIWCARKLSNKIITSSLNGIIKIWDYNLNVICEIELISEAVLSFDVYDNIIIAGGYSGNIYIIDFTKTPEITIELKSHNDVIRCIEISPDKKTFTSTSQDNSIIIWELPTYNKIHKCTHHSDWVWSASYINNTTIATSSSDKKIIIYNYIRNKITHILESHNDWIWSISYSNSSNLLISSSTDQSLKIWGKEGEKYYLINSINGYSTAVWTAVYNKRKKQYYGTYEDHSIKGWSSSCEEPKTILIKHTHRIQALKNSHDYDLLISAGEDKKVIIWDIEKKIINHCIDSFSSWIWCLELSKNIRKIYAGDGDGFLHFIDYINGNIIYSEKIFDEWIISIKEKNINNIILLGSKGGLSIYNSEKKEANTIQKLKNDRPTCLAYCKKNNYIFMSSEGGIIYIYSEIKNKIISSIKISKQVVKNIYLHESMLLACDYSGYLYIVDINTFNVITSKKICNNKLRSIDIEDEKIVCSSEDGTIIVTDLYLNIIETFTLFPPYKDMDITFSNGLSTAQTHNLISLGAKT